MAHAFLWLVSMDTTSTKTHAKPTLSNTVAHMATHAMSKTERTFATKESVISSALMVLITMAPAKCVPNSY